MPAGVVVLVRSFIFVANPGQNGSKHHNDSAVGRESLKRPNGEMLFRLSGHGVAQWTPEAGDIDFKLIP